MTPSERAPLTGACALALAAAMALPVYSGETLAGILALFVVLMCVSWPRLLELPSRTGSAIIMALAGLGSLALALIFGTTGLASKLVIVIAVSLFLSFAHEMLRRERSRLTLSISGTASGALITTLTVIWLKCWSLASTNGPATVGFLLAMTMGLALGTLFLALPLPAPARVSGAITLGALTSGFLGWALHYPLSIIAMSALAGAVLCIAALFVFFLLSRVIGASDPRQSLAVAIAPIALTGILALLFLEVALSYVPADLGLTIIPTA